MYDVFYYAIILYQKNRASVKCSVYRLDILRNSLPVDAQHTQTDFAEPTPRGTLSECPSSGLYAQLASYGERQHSSTESGHIRVR